MEFREITGMAVQNLSDNPGRRRSRSTKTDEMSLFSCLFTTTGGPELQFECLPGSAMPFVMLDGPLIATVGPAGSFPGPRS
jgi:hypothetical protein